MNYLKLVQSRWFLMMFLHYVHKKVGLGPVVVTFRKTLKWLAKNLN